LYSNADDEQWQMATRGRTQRIRADIPERGAAI